MRARLAVAGLVGAAVLGSFSQPVAAQADVHARAIARASCQSGKNSNALADAKAAVAKDPDVLGPHMRLADILVDQGCYQEAMEILEAAQESFPRSVELSGKLRDVRSLVTEQTYIEGLTQAAESAKIARNQFRCTKLADITACEDALHAKPDDAALLLAKADALTAANRPAEALTAYRHVSQLKPTDESVKAKLANAEALVAKLPPPAASPPTATASISAPAASDLTTSGSPAGPAARSTHTSPSTTADTGPSRQKPRKAPVLAAATQPAQPKGTTAPPNGGQHPPATPTPAVAALSPPDSKTYSNEAPPGQTN